MMVPIVAGFAGARHAPPPLSERSDRRAGAPACAAGAARQAGWAAPVRGRAGGDRRHPVGAAHWGGLAGAAARRPAVADGRSLLPAVAPRRHLGSDPRRAARPGAAGGGAGGGTRRGGGGEPVGQDDRTGGPAATTPPRRSPAASATSSALPWGSSSRRSSTRRISKRARGRSRCWGGSATGSPGSARSGSIRATSPTPSPGRTPCATGRSRWWRGRKGATGWGPLPRRWGVERKFAWVGRCRRLSKDDEGRPAAGEAGIHLARTPLMLERLAPA